MGDKEIWVTLAVISVIAGSMFGFVGLLTNNSVNSSNDTVRLDVPPDVHHSTKIRGIFVVKTENVAGNEADNLFNDPSGIVEASITSSGGSATLAYGVDYTLAVATWGEDNETSLNTSNLRLGIDGDYWGDGDGSVQMPGENIIYENEYATGFTPSGEDQQHHAVNYWAKDSSFTPSRDESISINEILLQAYF